MQQSSSPELVYSFNHIDTQWLDSCVIMGYNFLLNPLLLEFYTYSQSSRGVKHDEINIDKNIITLKITLNNNQILTSEKLGIYPNVTRINNHSQMTTTVMENGLQNRCDSRCVQLAFYISFEAF
ncbi:unnamed protein product [Rotaria sp. Silwood2]|nr:unnamed protein product [Rotaria sp. Silwood2]CAF3230954.1 unnamed protein product [Rotaria sp. Silwood2]CAF3386845.1 unnamed protein product [Rotaria sp. Silwood2]CAF4277138.1 unnamed protein product [Rotaria sp. Silwood2]CAF4360937.1 unnamed protein product [Rotaria sp. Silwood2]